jgi:hypothetical protein
MNLDWGCVQWRTMALVALNLQVLLPESELVSNVDHREMLYGDGPGSELCLIAYFGISNSVRETLSQMQRISLYLGQVCIPLRDQFLLHSRSSAPDTSEGQVPMEEVKPERPKQCRRDRTGLATCASDTISRQHGCRLHILQSSTGTQMQWNVFF